MERGKKIINYFTVLGFFLILAFPMVNGYMQFIDEAEIVENRQLDEKPVFDINSLDDYTEAYNTYYSDNFSLRTHFIDFNNPYDYRNIILLGDVSSNNKKNKSNLTEQFDLLKTSPIFQNRKKLSKYRFLLMPGTEDTLMIEFRAIKPTYKRIGFYHLRSYSGYIKALRKHNAIVEISIIAEKDAELLKNNSHKKRSVNAKRNDFDVI